MTNTPLSAAANLVLLEPASKGKDAMKAALKELIARRCVSLGSSQHRGLFGHQRSVVTLQVHHRVVVQDSGLAELRRTLIDVSRSGKDLAQILRALQRHYGNGYAKYLDGFVMPALLRGGLMQWREATFLWVFKQRRAALTAQGQQRQRDLHQQMDRARMQAGQGGSSPQEMAAMIASLGAAVILLPELWPQWRRLEQGLRVPPDGGDGFEFSAELEDFDRQCSDVDAAMDASDGGDGGGDGGGD